MQRILNQLLPVLLLYALITTSCNGELIPSNKKPSINVKFNGSTNGEMKFEGKCDRVFAMYSPEDPSSGFRFLNIQGTDGSKSFNIILYWSGAFPSPAQFNLDLNASSGNKFGVGQYLPDIFNSTNTYQSTFGTPGTCTISQYDQSKQTVSGTFQFTAELMINGSPTGNTASFTGDFNNIPINDMTDPNNPKGPCFNSTGSPLGSGGGGPGGGGTTSTITFINQTYTPITITFNGQTKSAAVGSNAIFTGNPNNTASGTATTSGKTSSGTQVGLLMTWPISLTFPAAGTNYNYNLGLGPNYFFLKIKNQSNRNILKVYVNYGITDQTLDNVSIPNNGSVYNLGYYKAYLHSNVRAENGNYYWFWNALNLPITNNQSTTVIAQ